VPPEVAFDLFRLRVSIVEREAAAGS